MKTFGKITLVVTSIIMLFLLYVQLTYKRKFEAPLTGITASADSAIIARGQYLVMNAGHCYTCHLTKAELDAGKKEPMTGGYVFETPFATFYTPNLTMDTETGIGLLSDEQLARAIRHHINRNGNLMAPFMSYNAMGQDDLQAIVSYLRSQPAVHNEVPSHEYNMIGKLLMRFVLEPVYASIQQPVRDTSALYGQYLAHHVTNCNGCHTGRDKLGAFVGKPMAGGSTWEYEGAIYTSPNLTFDDSTGWITDWTRDTFIQRFRAGKRLPHTPMPWEAYTGLSDNDLKALYAYLQQLEPAHNPLGPTYTLKTKTE